MRARPQRQAARRRKQGLADYLFLGLLGGVAVMLAEHFWLKLAWPFAIFAAVMVAAATVAWSLFLERRRSRSAQQPPKRR